MTRRKTDKKARRNLLVAVIFIIWLGAVGVRAGYLQLYKGPSLSRRAASEYEKQVVAMGKRGTIYDRRHQPMAVSLEAVSIAAHPGQVDQPAALARAIAKILHCDRRSLQRRLASGQSFVWLKRQVPSRQAAEIAALDFKGLVFVPDRARVYPNKNLAGQVIGFTGIDGHGLEGLEFIFDDQLSGGSQTITILKDGKGRRFETDISGIRSGNDLVLTIDRQIQFIAEQAVATASRKFAARSAMALVMVPSSGEILALAHWPFFNPNDFRRYTPQVWRNRAITDPFEPGSTMKIFSAAAALETGSSAVNTIYYCENGALRIGRETIHDTKGHGWLSLQQIVKYSSNIGTYKVAQKIGAQSLYNYLRAFGFGEKTKVECPGESAGALPYYKRWKPFDTGSIAFGQGISVTALQLLSAAAALANNGLLMQPHIVKAIVDPNGRPVKTFAPRPLRQVVSTRTARTVRRIMKTVITKGGTGTLAALEGYSVCGKTGTAQKVDRNGYADGRYVASFVGFAPVEKPRIAVLVVIDEPKKEHYGGTVAAPAFRRIVSETLSYLNVPPAGKRPILTVSRKTGVQG